jgi:hypothetical protein
MATLCQALTFPHTSYDCNLSAAPSCIYCPAHQEEFIDGPAHKEVQSNGVHTKLCKYRAVGSVDGLPQVADSGSVRARCLANAVRGKDWCWVHLDIEIEQLR